MKWQTRLLLLMMIMALMDVNTLPSMTVTQPAFAQSLDAAVQKRIVALLKTESCLDYTQIAVAEWNRILDLFIADSGAEKHVLTRFRDLKAKHADTLGHLEGFARYPLPTAATPAELSNAIEELKAEYGRLGTLMEPVRKADGAFLWVASEAEQSLVDITGILERTPVICDAATRKRLTNEAQEAFARREEVTLARKYVADAGIRRERMLSLTYEVKKNALLKAHADATGQALASVRAQLEGILEMGDLLPEFIHWRFSRVARGYGDGEITFYEQYEAGLAGIAQDIATANQWRTRFESIKGIADDLRTKGLREVDSFIADQNAMRDKREKMGWEGHLARQRFLVGGMRGLRDKYPKACGPMLDAFDAKTTNVKSLLAYRRHEAFYRLLVDACNAGPKRGSP